MNDRTRPLRGFDPNKMPPPGIHCAVLDAMARELSGAAYNLQLVLRQVARGEHREARNRLLDIAALRPARQYLLGVANTLQSQEGEA